MLTESGTHLKEKTKINNADMGIRTPVLGVKGRNDWPDYTISARVAYIGVF